MMTFRPMFLIPPHVVPRRRVVAVIDGNSADAPRVPCRAA